MKTFFLFTILYSLCLFSLQANTFKTLIVQGEVLYQSAPSINWLPLQRGTVVKSVDSIKISDIAYVGLIHVSGQLLELTNKGTYALKNYTAKNKSITPYQSTLLDSILENFEKTQKIIEDKSYFNYLNNPKNIESMHGMGLQNLTILQPFPTTYVYDTVYISWYYKKNNRPKGEVKFNIKLVELGKDSFSTLISLVTKDTCFRIPLDSLFPNSKKMSPMVLSVTTNEGLETDETRINPLSPAMMEKNNTALKNLSQLFQSRSALADALIGFYYDLNYLNGNANRSFLHSFHKAPQVLYYKEIKQHYLFISRKP